jgi:hypothetical protein
MISQHESLGRGRMARAALICILAASGLLFAPFTSPARAQLAITNFDGAVLNTDGTAASQAGSHPFVAESTISLASELDPVFGNLEPVEAPRDVFVELPPGFVGDPQAAPTCAVQALAGSNDGETCPIASQVGVVGITPIGGAAPGQPRYQWHKLFNMVPPPNKPAAFGFVVSGPTVTITASVRSGSDYGLDVNSENISQTIGVSEIHLKLWGVPADHSHDELRGGCLDFGDPSEEPKPYAPGCEIASNTPRKALLRNPTSCPPPGVGLETRLHANSWQTPNSLTSASFVSHQPAPNQSTQIGPTGCEKLPFKPTINIRPTSTAPDSPTGLKVELSVPQEGLLDPDGLATADLRQANVVLPEGMVVNPSAAGGLGACSSAQIAIHDTTEPSCPESSKIGTVRVDTPLLEKPLEGNVYLASQTDNPFGSLLAIYLVAKGPGVIVKLAGHVEADAVTGRLTTVFDNQPQLPFTSLVLSLNSGPRAPLVTPSACGDNPITSQLTGWNGKSVSVSNHYNVDCTAGLGGFSPSFEAGTVNTQAGAFSPFTLTLSRSDGQQRLAGIAVQMPPGLLGVLKNVVQCPEAQAANGSCSPASELGHTTVAAGAGPTPFWLGGKVFLTGPYKGAPFGLSVVVPAIAGPFNLGTVVVRAAINVDPHTAQVTVTSDPLPTILQGIPLQLRTVNVTIDRSGFMFNPTNCSPLSVGGTISSTQGAAAAVSSQYQAANCANLPFKPKFTAFTQAKHSKVGGESLHVKVTSGSGQANIAKVRVLLPKTLPSRLTTLQKACVDAVFNVNPASCPVASLVGTATAVTPVLAHPLTGPAYLVSHGGAAFPDLVVVLQGEGITLYLDGNTDIKKGITSSTFNSVPDAPISTFDLDLPQGPHSALAANGNLCKGALNMPTTITGQNGARITQSTRIAVSGCPKAKKHSNVKHGRKHKKK